MHRSSLYQTASAEDLNTLIAECRALRGGASRLTRLVFNEAIESAYAELNSRTHDAPNLQLLDRFEELRLTEQGRKSA